MGIVYITITSIQVVDRITSVIYNITNANVTWISINAVILYSRTIERLKTLYKTNFVFKFTIDCCTKCFQFIQNIFVTRLVEPNVCNWISISVSIKPYTFSAHEYNDEYLELEDGLDNAKITTIYNEFIEHTNVLLRNLDIAECMVIMKYDGIYTVRSFTRLNIIKCIVDTPIKYNACGYKFISLEYTHPDMTDSIIIELDKYVYYENNVLLTPLFVKRCLEYQYLPYKFDDDYIINIMDSKLKFVTITNNDYILLEKDSYSILSRIGFVHSH
jgi:hypothetical protein